MAEAISIFAADKLQKEGSFQRAVFTVRNCGGAKREKKSKEKYAAVSPKDAKAEECESPELALLKYVALSVLSETSKIAIFAFLFRHQMYLFLFAVGVMLLLRCSNGGMHCKRYLACFAVSFFYLFLCIDVLPLLWVPKSMMLLILLICMCGNYKIGLVLSKYHKKPDEKQKKKGGIESFVIVFLYMTALYILPENNYMCSGFWVIVLHSLQLALAEFNLKGDFLDEKGLGFFKGVWHKGKFA